MREIVVQVGVLDPDEIAGGDGYALPQAPARAMVHPLMMANQRRFRIRLPERRHAA